ncbi:MAG: hypothetical protein MI864_20445 [Pseudomonadales bacterium]|nr:hypothetical protein [Pseudomonadales bacterium]
MDNRNSHPFPNEVKSLEEAKIRIQRLRRTIEKNTDTSSQARLDRTQKK